MYSVSDAYKIAMKRPVQRSRLRGSLTSGLRVFSYTEKNIKKGSFSVNNQCSGNNEVEIGTVYTAELQCTLIELDIPRYSLQKAVITPRHELLTSEGYESVPLGIFNIKEANWTQKGIEIKAYDNMIKFDKSCTLSNSQGQIYDFLAMACAACHVEMAQSRADIQELPNGSADLAIYAENDIETWRDLVSWCAQTTATFATINREGKLELKLYGEEPVDEIDSTQRITGSKFSDFETRYTGLSCVNIAAQTTSYYGLEIDDGLTYNLGSNPLLQYGLEETLAAQRRNILNALAIIDYVPMEVSMIGSPAYDVGDILRFKDGIADETKISCITKYDWTYGNQYSVTGVGKNPDLSTARSKVDKDISGLMAHNNDDAIHYYDYLNAVDYRIADGHNSDIINIRYITTKNTHIDFHAEVKFKLDTTETEYTNEAGKLCYEENDGKVKVTYYLNGDEIDVYYPMEQLRDGIHMIHLLYTWNSSANVIGTFKINMKVNGAEINIDRYAIHAYMAGQGLAGDDAWDGTVKVNDSFESLSLNEILNQYNDSVVPSTCLLPATDLSDDFELLDMSLIMPTFADALGDRYWMHRYDVHTADVMSYSMSEIQISDNVYSLIEGNESGTITTPSREAAQILQITSNNSGSNVGFIVSFDGGDNWWTYTSDWVEPDYTQDMYGMFESKLRSITPEKWAEKLEGTIMVKALLLTGATLRDIQIYLEEIE